METSPIDGQSGRAPLRRDEQQWVLDYIVQTTGKVVHFQGDGRGALPRAVHSHAMISKHVGRKARGLEQLAENELASGHRHSALTFFYQAADQFARAQHPVFALNEEKRLLSSGVRRCYDKVRELSPYPIEHIDIPWENGTVSGNLHLNPDVDGPAPIVFYIAGCDVTKESWPHPHLNHAHQRGMHAFSFDGPGQGESIMTGIALSADNYERAARAAVDYLVARPEVDADNVLLYATSFGSLWGMRLAGLDPRIKAIAAPQASLCEKFIQTDLESPRWKQLLAFLTHAESEAELDRIMADMTMHGYMEKVKCPTLLTVGEYDPRAPLEDTYAMFDQLTTDAELWVLADQHHMLNFGGGEGWARASHGVCLDWLYDRSQGHPVAHPGEVVWVEGNSGPNAPDVKLQRHWYGS